MRKRNKVLKKKRKDRGKKGKNLKYFLRDILEILTNKKNKIGKYKLKNKG